MECKQHGARAKFLCLFIFGRLSLRLLLGNGIWRVGGSCSRKVYKVCAKCLFNFFINIKLQHGGRIFFLFQSFRCGTEKYCAVETVWRCSVWASRGHTYILSKVIPSQARCGPEGG